MGRIFRAFLFLLPALWLAVQANSTASSTVAAPPAVPSASATATPSSMTFPDSGWLIVPELPASATQADYGAEVYRLTCAVCHGADRLGLTPEWRSTWPEAEQNCWQSKCHAANHPPDGFALPRAVPPLTGPTALRGAATAFDLYQFIKTRMPWQNPGSLTDQQYWQLTAFLIREEGLASLDGPLTTETASALRLHPAEKPPVQPMLSSAGNRGESFWWITLATGAVLLAISALLYARRRAGK